jgi:hypothetical protein
VFLFLYTDDFARDYRSMRARGVTFAEAPREEPYGTVAVFEDLYGNTWDLCWNPGRNPAADDPARRRGYRSGKRAHRTRRIPWLPFWLTATVEPETA